MMTDDMANKFANAKPDRNGFMLRREHFSTIKNLKSDPSIVITRPDKGNSVVAMILARICRRNDDYPI